MVAILRVIKGAYVCLKSETIVIAYDARGNGGGDITPTISWRYMKKTAFNQLSQSAVYREDDTSVSLTVCGGSYGGGSECLIVETYETDNTDREEIL